MAVVAGFSNGVSFRGLKKAASAEQTGDDGV
jgi:hypothetical protein